MFQRIKSEMKFIREKSVMRFGQNYGSDEQKSGFTVISSKSFLNVRKLEGNSNKWTKKASKNKGSVKNNFIPSKLDLYKLPKLIIQKQKLHIKEEYNLSRNMSNNSMISNRFDPKSSRAEVNSRRRTIFKELTENHYKFYKKTSKKSSEDWKLKGELEFDINGWDTVDYNN